MLIRAQASDPATSSRVPVSDVELMMQGLALMTAGIDTTSMLLANGARTHPKRSNQSFAEDQQTLRVM